MSKKFAVGLVLGLAMTSAMAVWVCTGCRCVGGGPLGGGVCSCDSCKDVKYTQAE